MNASQASIKKSEALMEASPYDGKHCPDHGAPTVSLGGGWVRCRRCKFTRFNPRAAKD